MASGISVMVKALNIKEMHVDSVENISMVMPAMMESRESVILSISTSDRIRESDVSVPNAGSTVLSMTTRMTMKSSGVPTL